MASDMSMGAIFQQRRAAKQQANRSNNRSVTREQGKIRTLKDSFGFIYCADRPDEVFFHFSQLQDCHPADLQLDDELEFEVGTSRNDPSKLAAYRVCRLPHGTIVWQTPISDQRRQGLVERPIRSNDYEGTIRMLPDKESADEDSTKDNTNKEGTLVRFSAQEYNPDGRSQPNRLFRGDLIECSLVLDRRTQQTYATDISLIMSERERDRMEKERKLMETATLEQGVVTSLKNDYGFLKSNARKEEVYFHYSHVQLESNDGDDHLVLAEGQDMEFYVVNEGGNSSGTQRVSARKVEIRPRGSVVFHTVLARGVTGTLICRPHPEEDPNSGPSGSIRLTEPLEIEDEDLDNPDAPKTTSTLTQVKLYFRDSPGGEFSYRGGAAVGIWIREGDTLLFDVVKELADGTCWAAPTTCLVPLKKQPAANKQDQATEEENDEDRKIDGDESKSEQRSSEGVKESAGDADEKAEDDQAAAAGTEDEDDDIVPAVRLIGMGVAGRAEGTVHALKDSYGFIHFSERPVDVHFKLFELIPDELQEDMRRNMGLETVEASKIPLDIGTEVQFDMSVHGMVTSTTTRSRHRHGQQQAPQPHERENLKAQRVLLLPPNTIEPDKVLAKGVRAVVTKEDPQQLYAGNIELEQELKQMSLDDRHPFVAKAIDDFLKSDETSLVFHDIQSLKEDEIMVEMADLKSHGLISCSHIPVAGDPNHPGRLCLQKKDPEAKEDQEKNGDKDSSDGQPKDEKEHPEEKSPKSRKKKKAHKAKPIKSIRYHKANLLKELEVDLPPTVGDVVVCDVIQSRRTGMVSAENINIIERKAFDPDSTEGDTETSGVGVVRDIVTARNFGFISVLDENATNRELLFFQLPKRNNQEQGNGKGSIRKGDEVSFDVTVENGKRVAKNVRLAPKRTIPNKAEKGACRGYILMEPSHTLLKDTPLRHSHSMGLSSSSHGSDKGGRWEVHSDSGKSSDKKAGIKEEGCILLLEDPTGMFSRGKSSGHATPASSDGEGENATNQAGPSAEDQGELCAIGSHLVYKNGAIAIHGTGASSAMDESTNPRRGDLVSFAKAKGSSGVRDIRVVKRSAAKRIRGRLECISRKAGEEGKGDAKFISDQDGKAYVIDLGEVVSCEVGILKNKEPVEGILHDGKVYGVCRTADLYLESKLGKSHKERPRLNLTVRKDRKGTIMAQSMMAKGPDGTHGFHAGWTKRVSMYAPVAVDFAGQVVEGVQYAPIPGA